jgi:hypothetical protein
MEGTIWYDRRGDLKCQYHKTVTQDPRTGRLSCGCQIFHGPRGYYAVRAPDKRNLPHAGRADAK